MKYYAIIDGVQKGPMEASALQQLPGFSAETPVWCETMSDWLPASQVDEPAWLFNAAGNTPPPLDGTPQPEPGFGPRIRPINGATAPYGFTGFTPDPARRPFNWLGWSIFNTVMGLLFGWISTILGVVGIIYSAQATSRYRQCDYEGAQSAARVAKIVNIIGLVILGVAILLVISLIGFLSFMADYF